MSRTLLNLELGTLLVEHDIQTAPGSNNWPSLMFSIRAKVRTQT
jgi:hypothetical protein